MNREPDIDARRAAVLLKAADLIDREGHYEFFRVTVPSCSSGVACVAGWIAYCLNTDNIAEAAQWLGYDSETGLYEDMNRVRGPVTGLAEYLARDWHMSHRGAAETLRKLAAEKFNPAPAQWGE